MWGPLDLPLEKDAGGRLLSLVMAAMVFLAVLALAGAFILDHSLAGWRAGVAGRLTVEIAPGSAAAAKAGDATADADAAAAASVKAALKLLRAHRAVARATPLGRRDIETLLKPWLGAGPLPKDIPVPRLISVRLKPGASLDTAALRKALRAKVPDARLDDASLWLKPLVRFIHVAESLSAAVVLLIALATVMMVVFATRAGLAVHHEVIELLHLMGARDSYIARQFALHTFKLSAIGAVLGIGAAAAILWFLGRIAAMVALPVPPAVHFSHVGWAALAAVPLFAVLLAVWTARLTVRRTLKHMM